jgi:hypothetical protein
MTLYESLYGREALMHPETGKRDISGMAGMRQSKQLNYAGLCTFDNRAFHARTGKPVEVDPKYQMIRFKQI